jgi:xylan 1,4-beta-xylosidase
MSGWRSRPYDSTDVILQIEADHEQYTFFYGQSVDSLAPLGTGLVRYLSQHVAGGFTGVYLAMYAAGNDQPVGSGQPTGTGRPCATPADFGWFDYEPWPDEVKLGWAL